MLEKEETVERFRKDIKLLKKHEYSPKQIHQLLSKILREETEIEENKEKDYIDKYFVLDLKQEIKIINIYQIEKDENDKIVNLIGEKLEITKNKLNFSLSKGKIALEKFKILNYKELTKRDLKYLRTLISDKISLLEVFFKNLDEEF